MSVFDTRISALDSKKAEFAASFIASIYSNNDLLKVLKADAQRLGTNLENIIARNAIYQVDVLLERLYKKP